MTISYGTYKKTGDLVRKEKQGRRTYEQLNAPKCDAMHFGGGGYCL